MRSFLSSHRDACAGRSCRVDCGHGKGGRPELEVNILYLLFLLFTFLVLLILLNHVLMQRS